MVNADPGFARQMTFRFPWRTYQARVIGEIASHLDDRKLHVVAAPGSGKTVLGLEAIRVIGAPALVLSPTLTIRDQWIDRLTGMFLPEGAARPEWVSTDIRHPGAITSITYQALHMAVTGFEAGDPEDESDPDEADDDAPSVARGERPSRRKASKINVPDLLRRAGVTTVVLDECHHLRSDWWRTLNAVVGGIEQVRIIGLTATPPYDVDPLEWERYQKLCGPIDAEISVPELVADLNLCPHQDYVYVSRPSGEERAVIRKFRSDVQEILKQVAADPEFIAAIEAHPFLERPADHVDEILNQTAYFSSIAIFLNRVRGAAPRRLLRVMGLDGERIPALTTEWWEELLSGCLFAADAHTDPHAAVLERVKRDLARIGAVDRGRVFLQSTRKMARMLAASVSKLSGIRDIVELEHGRLKERLRLVILTDFIRSADMPATAGDEEPVARLGVAPIFELLRRDGNDGVKLGILSGSLVVVPAASVPLLKECAAALGIGPDAVRCSALPHDPGYVSLNGVGEADTRVVRIVTDLFTRGGITVLVGTKSLLGEGWDAPSVNALILATFVGSYMLSNQMRGRAIRVEKGNPDKTANIWHLVCVQDDTDEAGQAVPGADWETLTRRFQAFVGPTRGEPVIQNGVGRLGLGGPPFTEKRVDAANVATKEAAADREGLRQMWVEALSRGAEGSCLVQEIQAPKLALPQRCVFRDAIRVVLMEGVGAMMCCLSSIHVESSGHIGLRALIGLLAVVTGGACLVGLPFFLKALWLLLRHGSLAGSLKQVGQAVLRSLDHAGIVTTDVNKMRVRTEPLPDKTGAVCFLDGGTTYEKTVFLDALAEVVNPIEDPRYVLIRKSLFGWWVRRDFHAVPTVLARQKETAETFAGLWKKTVGPMELVYTRTPEGRQTLLKARGQALSSALLKRSERRSVWR